MPLLRSIVNSRIQLLDYELFTNPETSKRLVVFGTFAGYAGMVDSLHGIGLRLLSMGHGTPFLHVGMTHMYRSLFDAKAALRMVGLHVAHEGLPKELGPFLIVVAGSGNVSTGAKEVLDCLDPEWIAPDAVAGLQTTWDPKKIYATVVKMEHYLVHQSGSPFSRSEFLAHPDRYRSVFHEKFAPHAAIVVNGTYWDHRYPRLVTKEQARAIYKSDRPRMLAVSDISCDIDGSLEFTNKASTIDHPFFYYDPLTGSYHNK
jgi:alpha-aminoadipic semialdehyde synthase